MENNFLFKGNNKPDIMCSQDASWAMAWIESVSPEPMTNPHEPLKFKIYNPLSRIRHRKSPHEGAYAHNPALKDSNMLTNPWTAGYVSEAIFVNQRAFHNGTYLVTYV